MRAREPLERLGSFSPQASGADRGALAPSFGQGAPFTFGPVIGAVPPERNLGETAPGFGWLSCAGGHQGVVADVMALIAQLTGAASLLKI
ncbi:MAG TPA: hypothetical protein VIZ19_00770 [Roseiarcus sp.]